MDPMGSGQWQFPSGNFHVVGAMWSLHPLLRLFGIESTSQDYCHCSSFWILMEVYLSGNHIYYTNTILLPLQIFGI